MKETTRTASITEIYDDLLKNLHERKKRAEKNHKLLSARAGIGGCFLVVLTIISILHLVVGIAMSFDKKVENGSGKAIIIIGLVFCAGCALGFKGMKNLSKRKNLSANYLSELNLQILSTSQKKSMYLKAEEHLLENEHNESSVPTPVLIEEKNCPMCAEIVKKAAKICRYCGHKFEVD